MTTAPAGVLVGRTALVTGGAGAIGRAVAHQFLQEGATVAIADLDGAAAQQVATDLTAELGGRAVGIAMDVADPADVERAAAELTDQVGICDALVVNAGILVLKNALELSSAEFRTVMAVNLGGSFHTATEFGRRLVDSGRPGTIAFTSSLFGVRGGRGNAAYSASKFGIIGLAQSMAAELAEHRIRVNSVCPGQIRTPMLDALFAGRATENGTSAEHEEAVFAARIPGATLGSVDDVAKAFVYLSSDQSSYVTGQHLVVDGGWQVG